MGSASTPGKKGEREGPIARTITFFACVPVIMNPPIRTLSPVSTRKRVEMFPKVVGVGVGDAAGVGVGVGVAAGVRVGVGVGEPTGVAVGVGVALAVGVGVGVVVGVGVGASVTSTELVIMVR